MWPNEWFVESYGLLDFLGRMCSNSFQFQFLYLLFKFLGLGFVITPCKAEQPLGGMELQEKEAQKD